jgi:hypothetical protein
MQRWKRSMVHCSLLFSVVASAAACSVSKPKPTPAAPAAGADAGNGVTHMGSAKQAKDRAEEDRSTVTDKTGQSHRSDAADALLTVAPERAVAAMPVPKEVSEARDRLVALSSHEGQLPPGALTDLRVVLAHGHGVATHRDGPVSSTTLIELQRCGLIYERVMSSRSPDGHVEVVHRFTASPAFPHNRTWIRDVP